MEEHPIQGLMTTAMESLKDMIEVNTIVGDPVETPDGTIIIPVSKLGFGFAAGGSEFNATMNAEESSDATLPFGGGSGGGVSITPVAFLVIHEQGVKMIHLDQNTHIFEKVVEKAPEAFEKIQEMLKESDHGKANKKRDKNQGSNYNI